MKKLLIVLLTLFFTTVSFGATENIHSWSISPTTSWRTSIILTNACHEYDVDVSVQLWKSDGTLLSNKDIGSHTTNSNGEIFLHLTPHQTSIVSFLFGYFEENTIGSGTVTTSYSKPAVECVVGEYMLYHTKVNAPNPYGYMRSFIFNNGKKF